MLLQTALLSTPRLFYISLFLLKGKSNDNNFNTVILASKYSLNENQNLLLPFKILLQAFQNLLE
jgi:hypothetical protein